MNRPHHRSVKELFNDALELAPEERGEFLDRACSDAGERAAVEALLEASLRADDLFEGVQEDAARVAASWEADGPVAGAVGRVVGAYRLESFLGRGGMGSVYRADRIDGQFQQRVAIKLLSLGALNPDAHRRFLAEREILARLQHPNIARLFDGGLTDDGTPYFVMELVEGAHIDEYCDEHALDVEARLKLFLQVCDAVAHAH